MPMTVLLLGTGGLLAGRAFAQAPSTPAAQDLQPRVNTSSSLSDAAVSASSARATSAAAKAAASASPAGKSRAPRAAGRAAQSESPHGGAAPPRPGAADQLRLGTTEISGNRELPKLMYIVPWNRPQIGAVVGRPPNSLVDETLTPVDRSVFERQNRYYAALQSAASAPSDPATASAPPSGRDEK